MQADPSFAGGGSGRMLDADSFDLAIERLTEVSGGMLSVLLVDRAGSMTMLRAARRGDELALAYLRVLNTYVSGSRPRSPRNLSCDRRVREVRPRCRLAATGLGEPARRTDAAGVPEAMAGVPADRDDRGQSGREDGVAMAIVDDVDEIRGKTER